ncbi:hypothetical protein [Microbacterium gorillae]|uniref:hypothetical protein n=1 Tax=Microbacterium gorillae TaxID=1231063 RepID=UPI00059115C5|nr:hypothetical protein [Microbacterium gorillae]
MRVSARRLLVVLALAFVLYLTARGLLFTGPVVNPALLIACALLIVVVTVVCLFAESRYPAVASDAPLTAGSRGPTVMPVWAGVLAVATAVVVPSVVALSVEEAHRQAAYATSYIGAIGALLTVLAVRRRALLAWIGAAALTVGAVGWLGPLAAFSLGMTGSIMWILAAQLLLRSMDRAARDTVRLVELQHAAVAWQTVHGARRRERRVRVRFALQVAGPVLSRVIETDGHLSEDERAQAEIAEGSLRDELRGARLLDERVRAELDAARARGIVVNVFDEGGLDGLDQASLDAIRAELADVVASASTERLIIRAARDPKTAVTVVGRPAESSDDIDLWHEIARSRPAEP